MQVVVIVQLAQRHDTAVKLLESKSLALRDLNTTIHTFWVLTKFLLEYTGNEGVSYPD